MLASLQIYEPDEPATVSFTTDYRASQVLWPHENQEELKRQVGNHALFRMVSLLFIREINVEFNICCSESKYLISSILNHSKVLDF